MRVVLDTNVIFEGLTKQGGASGLIIDAWLAGLFEVWITDAVAYEYVDVLSRKLSKTKWQKLQPVLGKLLNLAKFTPIYYSWRPTSPDPGDDLIIDCAMNASAIVVTFNVKDFIQAKQSLGLQVINPIEFIAKLI